MGVQYRASCTPLCQRGLYNIQYRTVLHDIPVFIHVQRGKEGHPTCSEGIPNWSQVQDEMPIIPSAKQGSSPMGISRTGVSPAVEAFLIGPRFRMHPVPPDLPPYHPFATGAALAFAFTPGAFTTGTALAIGTAFARGTAFAMGAALPVGLASGTLSLGTAFTAGVACRGHLLQGEEKGRNQSDRHGTVKCAEVMYVCALEDTVLYSTLDSSLYLQQHNST